MKNKSILEVSPDGEVIPSSLKRRRKNLMGTTIIVAWIAGVAVFFLFAAIILQPENSRSSQHFMGWRFYFHTLPYFQGMLSGLLMFLFKDKLNKAFTEDSTAFRVAYVLLGLMFFCFGWLSAEGVVAVINLSY